jgi:hypothetical protein
LKYSTETGALYASNLAKTAGGDVSALDPAAKDTRHCAM